MVLLLSIILLIGEFQGRGQGPGIRGPAQEAPSLAEVVGSEIVAGTVMHGDTTRPFSHVRLELRREDYGKWLSGREKTCNPARDVDDPRLRRLTVTDEVGRFVFRDVVPGRYYVVAEHEGYLRAPYSRQGRSPRGTVLEVGPQVDAAIAGSTQATALGGVSGAFLASYLGFVNPNQFTFSFSIFILAMVVLGGLGSIWGVVLGAIVLSAINNYLLPKIGLTEITSGIYGFLLVFLVVVRPRGLLADRRSVTLRSSAP